VFTGAGTFLVIDASMAGICFLFRSMKFGWVVLEKESVKRFDPGRSQEIKEKKKNHRISLQEAYKWRCGFFFRV
jgi:hypothetical protein